MNKKAFLFYLEYQEIFEPLSPEDCKQLLMFMIDYVKNLTEPNENLKNQMSDRLLMAWICLKQNLDRDNLIYDRRKDTSRENGLKGGRPPKPKEPNEKPKKPKKPVIEKEIDIEIIISSCSSYIEENYARAISSIEYEKLKSWCEEFDEELIRLAVDISVLNCKKTFPYVQGILNNWKGLGYKTKQDVLDHERKIDKTEETIELFDYDWINEKEESEVAA